MESTKLQVKHYGGEVRIPINGYIHYNCPECQDTGIIEQWIEVDDFREVPCPFCGAGEPADMDDDS